jgi:hypothetical protein
MMVRNSKRIAASGPTAAVVLASILVLGLGVIARAQSGGDNSQGGLEGAWRLQVTVRDCNTGQALRTFPAVFTFSKGGYGSRHHRRPAPLLSHPRFGDLAAYPGPQLQCGHRRLRF